MDDKGKQSTAKPIASICENPLHQLQSKPFQKSRQQRMPDLRRTPTANGPATPTINGRRAPALEIGWFKPAIARSREKDGLKQFDRSALRLGRTLSLKSDRSLKSDSYQAAFQVSSLRQTDVTAGLRQGW